MREKIHPDYAKSEVSCVCGASFVTQSTRPKIRVEVCSNCHPFYTGQRQRVASEGGRIERFLKKYSMTDTTAAEKKDDKEQEAQ